MQVPDVLRRVLGLGRHVASAGRDTPSGAEESVAEAKPKHEPAAKPLVAVPAARFRADPGGVLEELRTKLRAIGCLEHLQLPRTQRIVWLVLTYDGIARTEGHKQYFRTYGLGRASEVLAALTELGADSGARLLTEAIRRDSSYPDDNETAPGAIGSPSLRLGPPPDYSDVDSSYRELAPSIDKLLERYMLAHRWDFLSIDGAA